MRTSSSLCSSAVSHPSAHTVNGKYCCNLIEKAVEYLQPVKCSNTVNGMAITTVKANKEMAFMLNRFNIVNDKSCSNFNLSYWPERQSYLFQHRKR